MLSYACIKMMLMDGLVGEASTALAAFASRPAYGLSDEELTASLVEVYALASQATAVAAMLAREAQGRELPRRVRAASATTWLRKVLRVTAAEARRLLRLGETLEARPVLANAIAAETLNVAQAAAIGDVLEDVPSDDPALVDKVESVLIGYAARHEPTVLRRLGERVLAHVNPDLADARLRDELERQDRRARQHRGLTLSPDGLGGVRLRGLLDLEGAAIVNAALDPLARPVNAADGPDTRTAAARRADALIEVCRLAMRTGDLPDNGGTPPQLTVTVDYDALRRNAAVGQVDTGGLLSPTTTRRLACDAGVLPVLLNGASVPIDVGRTRRTFTGATRQAVVIRDGGCAFPGCDRPPRWTEIHHLVSWVDGGATDRDNGVALCGHHHRVVHHGDWQVRLGADRRPEFVPPAYIDAARRPCRNPYHVRR